MPQKQPSAAAILWTGNPDKWTGSGGMNSYVADKSAYVYWSTPARQCRHDEIQSGKRAYIWRTNSNSGPRGIIAVGTINEEPRQLSEGAHRFSQPTRLDAPNWSEDRASSEWKTGISIAEVRLKRETGMLTAEMLEGVMPRLNVLKNPRQTVYRVNAEQLGQIESLWEKHRLR